MGEGGLKFRLSRKFVRAEKYEFVTPLHNIATFKNGQLDTPL